MNGDQLYQRYQELQQYVGWTDADSQQVAEVARILKPHFPALVEDFYTELQRHEKTQQVIKGGEAQLQRLKASLSSWIWDLFAGPYDTHFVVRRWRVGLRHVEIGLEQVFTNAAISRLRNGMIRFLVEDWPGATQGFCQAIQTLNRLLDLDLAIIEDAYQNEYTKRQRHNERYATIGKVSGGIAHELRNPLNVVKTSVYYLLNAKQPTAEKTQDHLHRIERQVEKCDGIITTLSEFAKLPEPVMTPVDLKSLLRHCIEENVRRPEIRVEYALNATADQIVGEEKQLRIAFGNVVRNACDAMTAGGKLLVEASEQDCAVYVSFHDEGCGIELDKIALITEPLYTTKPHGLGLGLAVTKAILDRHGASLIIASKFGEGSTFTFRFPGAANDT